MEHQPGKESFVAISVVQGSPSLWVLRPSVALSPPLPLYSHHGILAFLCYKYILHAPPKQRFLTLYTFFLSV